MVVPFRFLEWPIECTVSYSKDMVLFNKRYRAAVSCSPDAYRFSWGGIWVWDDGQAGPCMVSVHGWCMGVWLGQLGRAWCMASV